MTPYLLPLDADALQTLGIPEPWNYGIQDRVRFGEIDVLGHVNNAAYLSWFETFRISYFRDLILPRIGTRQTIVLRAVGLDFLAEVKPDETYVLTGRTVEMRRTSFTQEYGVWVDGTLRTTGKAVIVTVKDGNKVPISDALRETLRSIDSPDEL